MFTKTAIEAPCGAVLTHPGDAGGGFPANGQKTELGGLARQRASQHREPSFPWQRGWRRAAWRAGLLLRPVLP